MENIITKSFRVTRTYNGIDGKEKELRIYVDVDFETKTFNIQPSTGGKFELLLLNNTREIKALSECLEEAANIAERELEK